jgi:hypothetical protein
VSTVVRRASLVVALVEAEGAIPDGTTVFDDEFRV